MKISMWMLFDNLTEYQPVSAINDGDAVIRQVRMFSAKEQLRPDTVYIGHADEFSGSDHDAIVLANGRDRITVSHCDAAELMNRVLSIFDRLRDWDNRLKEARLTQNPYQEIMRIANEEIRCPMVLGCKDLTVYAITEQYHDEDVYKGWDEVKEIRTLPVWLIKFVNDLATSAWSPDDVDPAIIEPWPGMKAKMQVRFNCYVNGEIWGHMMLYVDEYRNSEIQLARYVADLYGNLLERQRDKDLSTYSAYYWVADILDGKSFEKGAIHSLYWSHGWEDNELLQLYRIMAKREEEHNNVLYWLFDSITERLKGAVTFVYRDSIVVVGKCSPAFSRLAADCIQEVSELCGYRCGVSFPFTDIEKIGVFFRQAGYAVKYANEGRGVLHRFEDVAYDGVIEEFTSNTDWQLWIDPKVYDLMEMDRKQGRELYSTLVCYLSNGMHIGNTADQLFVHRNTLIKRLGRIEELLGRNLQDVEDRQYLYFCVNLIERMNAKENGPTGGK